MMIGRADAERARIARTGPPPVAYAGGVGTTAHVESVRDWIAWTIVEGVASPEVEARVAEHGALREAADQIGRAVAVNAENAARYPRGWRP